MTTNHTYADCQNEVTDIFLLLKILQNALMIRVLTFYPRGHRTVSKELHLQYSARSQRTSTRLLPEIVSCNLLQNLILPVRIPIG